MRPTLFFVLSCLAVTLGLDPARAADRPAPAAAQAAPAAPAMAPEGPLQSGSVPVQIQSAAPPTRVIPPPTKAKVAAPKPAPAVIPEGAVVAKKGESLDRLIARSMKHLPFRQDILRDVVVQKNPGAFKGGNAKSLIGGALVQLPVMSDFRHITHPAEMAATAANETDNSQPSAEPDPRKGWVRFP